jgi:hypothetical protein
VHVLLQVVFNPKDSNTFASASLDRTVKVRCPVQHSALLHLQAQ